MSLHELGIEFKLVPQTLAATSRRNLEGRRDLPSALRALAQSIPRERVAGRPSVSSGS